MIIMKKIIIDTRPSKLALAQISIVVNNFKINNSVTSSSTVIKESFLFGADFCHWIREKGGVIY